MCGRVLINYDELMVAAGDSGLATWVRARPRGAESSWNVTPTQQIPIVLTSAKDGSHRFELAHWGIIPPWNKDGKPKFTFNAKSETLLEKSTFAPSVKAQRCVIPVTGFYEWTGPKNKRIPHAIFGPKPILPLAGLYRWWKSTEGEWRLTATILTREATGVMSDLHDRMPVFVDDEILTDWIDPAIVGDQVLIDAVSELAVPYAERLREHEVRPLHGDGLELIASI